MNILIVSEYYPPLIKGGGEINIKLVAEALAEREKVTVLTAKGETLPTYERKNEVKIYRRLKTGKSPNNILSNLKRSFYFPNSIVKEVKKLCEKEKFDLIHFIGISCIAANKLKKLNMPLVTTIESYPSLCPKGDRIYHGKKECRTHCSLRKFVTCQEKCDEIGKTQNKWFIKYNPFSIGYIYWFHKRIKKSLAHCNIIAISKYLQFLLEKHGFPSIVIPNMINKDDFVKGKIKNKEKKILYLGSLTRFKGPQVILDAVRSLPVHIDFYGDGPLKNKLKEKIKEGNFNAKIHDPVPYKEIPNLYNKADLVIFPSLWPEPFGRISIEALAAKTPILGSNIGGIRETLPKEWLFEPGNSSQLKTKVKQFLDQDFEFPSINQYSKEIVIHNLIKFYKELLIS